VEKRALPERQDSFPEGGLELLPARGDDAGVVKDVTPLGRKSGVRLGSDALRSMTMTEAELESVVMDCLYEVGGALPSEIESSRHFFEYGIDFTLLVDLVVALEDRLSIAIPNEILDRVKCVDDLVRHVRLRVMALREQLAMQAPANETSIDRKRSLVPTSRGRFAARHVSLLRPSQSAG
jgi:acyl carrier protein